MQPYEYLRPDQRGRSAVSWARMISCVAAMAGGVLVHEARAEPDMSRPVAQVTVTDTWGVVRYQVVFATILLMERPIGDGRHETYRVARMERPGVNDDETIRWADSRSCDAVDEALHRLSELPAPRIQSPRASSDEAGPVPLQSLHGDRYEITIQGRTPQGSIVAMTMSATTGEVAEWGAWMLRGLENCD